ncbi:hypothetical protein Peur_025133 [Populus x canadensis]
MMLSPVHLPPVLPLKPPPLASVVCPEVLKPIPEVAYSSYLLKEVTVEDCSEDEALVEALLEKEQLDFSFFDDDSAASPTTEANTLTVQVGKGSVFSHLGPQMNQHELSTPTGMQEQSQTLSVQGTLEAFSDTMNTEQAPSDALDGWITVEP